MPILARHRSSLVYYRKFGESCKISTRAPIPCRSARAQYQLERISNLDCAMSINPGRTSAYSEDLRWRIVWQREGLGLCIQKVASNLGVDPSTVCRVVSLFKATGTVQRRPYPNDARPNKKLTKTVQLTIFHTVLIRPGIYLDELQTEVFVLTGVDVSVTTLCTFLRGSNFTRQRMQLVAKQRDTELRDMFAIDVSLYKSQQLWK